MTPKIEKEIQTIEMHTARVEAERDWETCPLRIVTMCITIYVSTAVLFSMIGVKGYFLNALIPTTAFFVSTLGLPPIKKWWIDKRTKALIIIDKEEL